MKTAKQIFDSRYEYYRNMENKPAIPLEARQMIFDAMELYASQSQSSVLPRDNTKELLNDIISWEKDLSEYESLETILRKLYLIQRKDGYDENVKEYNSLQKQHGSNSSLMEAAKAKAESMESQLKQGCNKVDNVKDK